MDSMADADLAGADRNARHRARMEHSLSLFHQRRFAEAVAVDRVTLAEALRDFGPGSDEVRDARWVLSGSLMEAGALAEAEALSDALVAELEAVPGAHAHSLPSAERLAGLVAEMAGKHQKSVDLHRRRYEREAAREPGTERQDRFTRTCARHLGWALVAQRQPAEARRAFDVSGAGHPRSPHHLLGLAACESLEQGSSGPIDAVIRDFRHAGKLDPDVLDKAARRMARVFGQR